jgi:hypothetical protein
MSISVFLCVFSSTKANTKENKISEVYIEASGGNNKAQERGL